MFVVKEAIVFFLIVSLTNFLVSIHGGCIHRYKSENSREKNAFVDSNQYHSQTFLEEPSIQSIEPIKFSSANTKPTNNKDKVSLEIRNNFGDLPKKCGPNEEKIHGECREV